MILRLIMNIKRAVLLSQLLGAYRLCDIQFLRTELNYLNTTFSMLGYPDHLIQSVDAAAWSKFLCLCRLPGRESWRTGHRYSCCLPAYFLQSCNTKLFNKQFNSLSSNLVQTNNSLSQSDNSPGIYVIPCSDCDCAYKGETGCGLNSSISVKEVSVVQLFSM